MIKNFMKLLEILEIDLSKLNFVLKPVKYQQIILPDESFFHDNGVCFTPEYIEHIEKIRDYARKIYTPLGYKKFFFRYGYDASFGENRLSEYFKSKGYAIVQPENLTLDDQLNILMNCEKFASTEGSCSHNSVFLKDNSEVLLIPRSATKITEYQLALNSINNKNVFYVDSALSIFATKDHGPFFYWISKQLREFFGDKITEKYSAEDYETFLQYFRFSLQNGFSASPESNEYYSKIMADFMNNLKLQKDLLTKYGVSMN